MSGNTLIFDNIRLNKKEFHKSKQPIELGSVTIDQIVVSDKLSTPKENMHYTCIASITIDSVMKIDKKNYPQVYLEECKYRIKKMSRFINSELDSDSELMAKLKSESDCQ